MRFIKTKRVSITAIVDRVIACHEKGQPVLVGTVSIEKSEIISGLLKKKGIKHEVLNAKFHEKKSGDYLAGGQKGRGYDCNEHGRPWYGYYARRQRGAHGDARACGGSAFLRS